MILLPLGLLLLMMWSLRWTAVAVSDTVAGLLKFAPRGEATAAIVTREAMGAFASCSPHAQAIRAAISQALRLDPWRINLMRACFADLGLWLVLLVASFFLQLNGLFVAAVAGWSLLLVLFGLRPVWFRAFVASILFFGLFLVFGEAFLRFSSGWMSMEINDWTMLVADNRPTAILVLTMAMIVISAVTGLEFLAPALALGGLASGMLSLNGAVALMWGERVGLTFRFAFQARRQIPSVRRLAKLLTLSHLIALPIAFLILGFARDGLGLAGGRDSLPWLIESFILLTILTAIPFFIVAATIGHFAAQTRPDDLMDRANFPKAWFEEGLMGPIQAQFVRRGLERRRAEMMRIRGGFNAEEWKKVPPHVREASKLELEHFLVVERAIETHLSSRWSFFGHQRD